MAVNVIVVIGTRPEAIKMLPVVLELQRSSILNPIVVSTGQHHDLVREILDLGDVEVDVDLGAKPSGSLNDFVATVMTNFGAWCEERFGPGGSVFAKDAVDVLEHGFPAGVLVHGDTSSALGAALAAFHLRIPVAHVEAGLRTGSTLSPFPEELNRQLISRIAAFHLAPTSTSEEHLVREGIDNDRVFVTGNTGIDTLLMVAEREVTFQDERLASMIASPRPLVVATAHRRESWGGGLARIGEGLRRVVERHPEVQIVLVTHPNPDARAEVSTPVEGLEQVHVVGALGYVEFAQLLKAARFAISDSGGIQEEAPALGTPVLVTRKVTERVEGLDAGTLRTVGTTPDLIASFSHTLLTDDAAYRTMSEARNPYGDGKAAGRVVAALEHLAGRAKAPAPFGPGFDRIRVLRAGGYPGVTRVDLPDLPLTHLE